MSSTMQPFASGPLAGNRSMLGVAAVCLAARFATWIRRRKTAFVLVDDTTVAQRLSIDFTLPVLEDAVQHGLRAGDQIYVPLRVLRKEALAGFSIVDGCGDAVSTLNRFEAITLTVEGFSTLIDVYATGWSAGSFKDTLGRIIGSATPGDARRTYDDAMAGALGAVLPGNEFRALLSELCDGYMMLVPVEYRPGTNCIFKVDAATPFAWSRPRFGSRLRTLSASLGIMSKPLQFPGLETGWAQSTHFEFCQPDGVRQLKVELEELTSSSSAPDQPRRRVQYGRPRVDLSLPIGDLAEPASSRFDLATAKVTLRSRRSGSLLAITVVAGLAAALQWTLAARLGELDTQTSSAVALVLPALLAAYLVRSEHAIAGRLLAGTRIVGLVVASAALATALLIGTAHLRTVEPASTQSAECQTAPDGAAWPPWAGLGAPELSCVLTSPPRTISRANPGVERAVEDLAIVTSIGAGILLLGVLCTEIGTVLALRRARTA